jgi:hypothetical protein
MSQTTKDVILGIMPALFGLIGTLVGAGITYRTTVAERRTEEDDLAGNHLLNLSDALQRVWRFIRFGAELPAGPNSPAIDLARDLQTEAKDARAALVNAGIPYRIALLALEPAERLAVRLEQRAENKIDPDDAQTLVAFLLDLFEHPRAYRHSRQVWIRLNAMKELKRGQRPLEGEDQTPFGGVVGTGTSPHGGSVQQAAQETNMERPRDNGENSAG